MTNVIITMAGFGRRFLDAGYQVPKYRIEAHGRSLFQWSLLSLRSFMDAGADFVFVVRADDQSADFIRTEAQSLGIRNPNVVEIDQPTDGQATTALFAGSAINRSSEPMLIYNIDTFVHPQALIAEEVRGDGWIPCFPAKGDHWSFAKANEDGQVTEAREKVRISDNATVGLYWFSSFDLYSEAYEAYYTRSKRLEAGERYVAPLYNHLLERGLRVFVQSVPLDAVIPLGVPAEVEHFRNSAPPIID